jgi:hypothetical protein
MYLQLCLNLYVTNQGHFEEHCLVLMTLVELTWQWMIDDTAPAIHDPFPRNLEPPLKLPLVT